MGGQREISIERSHEEILLTSQLPFEDWTLAEREPDRNSLSPTTRNIETHSWRTSGDCEMLRESMPFSMVAASMFNWKILFTAVHVSDTVARTTKPHSISRDSVAETWSRSVRLEMIQNLLLVSRFIEISKLSGETCGEVICLTKSILAHHGMPEQLTSDNGPQFAAAEFSRFAKEYGFSIRLVAHIFLSRTGRQREQWKP